MASSRHLLVGHDGSSPPWGDHLSYQRLHSFAGGETQAAARSPAQLASIDYAMPPSHLSGSRSRTRDLACPIAVGAAERAAAHSGRGGASLSLAPASEVPAIADR